MPLPNTELKLQSDYTSDAARLQRMVKELERGFDFLKGFDDDRVVSIFGSARPTEKEKTYQKAYKLGRLLAEAGIVVTTGGGPGIMEAANRGAFEVGGQSVGINIFLDNGERRNEYLTESIGLYYFFARKVVLAHIAQAYVFFPGGFGTLDEFFEITTLIVTDRIDRDIPIVLVGKQYWTKVIAFLRKTATAKYKAITPADLSLWRIVDTPEAAFKAVKDIKKMYHRHDSV